MLFSTKPQSKIERITQKFREWIIAIRLEKRYTKKEIISKFGLEVRDDTTFVVAKRRFQEQVDDPANLMVDGRPNEGDVIYYPLMNKFFEIAFVEDQEPFFQLGNLPCYKLVCKTFEYSSEEFNTGHADIDQADDRKSLDTSLAHQFRLEDGTLNQSSYDGFLLLETGDSHGNPLYLINEEWDDITTDGDAAESVQTKSAYADNLDLDYIETLIRQKLKFGKSTEKVYLIQKEND